MLIKKLDSLVKIQSMFECQELCVTYKHAIIQRCMKQRSSL